MKNFSYSEDVKNSVIEFIQNEIDKVEFLDCIKNQNFYDCYYDDLFNDDSITGNLSGSYYCNTQKAKEACLSDIDTIEDAVNESFIDMNKHFGEWKYIDVSTRCYILSSVMAEIENDVNEFYDNTIDAIVEFINETENPKSYFIPSNYSDYHKVLGNFIERRNEGTDFDFMISLIIDDYLENNDL